MDQLILNPLYRQALIYELQALKEASHYDVSDLLT